MLNIFQKFTTHSKNALKSAFDLALSSGHKTITPQHILYGLSQEKGSIAAQILTKANIESQEIEKNISNQSAGSQTITHVELSPAARKLLEKSFLIASLNQHKYIGTEHLLASILAVNDAATTDFLRQNGADMLELKRQVGIVLNSTSKFSDLTGAINYLEGQNEDVDFLPLEPEQNQNFFSRQATSAQPAILDLFATNLTDSIIQKKIDPVIGREDEISRLIHILCRRNKNNPLLLGDAGVGKTAIVEGLAKKIVEGDVPEILNNKKIYALDLNLVVAGTSFRGEFENRLKQILMEVKKNQDIILFIDEIHNIIGTGSATGSMDAANILKPPLARGEIRCIGATTPEGYKRQIENDPALERRFQRIFVNEATVEKTIDILQGIKTNYEIFHQVKIHDKAITAAAQLSERYITDRCLPDKAIDLIDEAASAVKIKQLPDQTAKSVKTLLDQLEELKKKKENYVAKEKFNLALKCRRQEKELLAQLEDLEIKQQKKTRQKSLPEITQKEIARVVAKMTGIPPVDLVLEEKARLLNLEKLLAKKVIDQKEVLRSIAEFIRRSRTGIASADRPIGSFMFLGPSGVGKTETARVLAETVFGGAQSLIKIDMSEFTESFNISKLIGAPAGYVGYREETRLTDAVKRRPYSVVLFDEIEKAHPQVFNLLLQILEDGHLTDGTGKTINFKNTIIIMTSNLGSENFNQQANLGFEAKIGGKLNLEKSWQEAERGVLKKLKEKFPPELLGRIDKTIIFKPLSAAAITKIAKLQLEELTQRLKQQNLNVRLERAVAKTIAKISYAPQTGARAIRKNIQELIESKIAEKILASKKNEPKNITVKVINDKIII